MTGPGIEKIEAEGGGHRVQRVPPTERRGRVQTSTVTVAVVDPAEDGAEGHPALSRNPADFRIEWVRGSGAGGQHRNKHANSARVTHIPTGIVETRQSRERESNLSEAMAAVEARLDTLVGRTRDADRSSKRRAQIGSGERGDKIRTYRIQDDRVIDDRTGKRASAERVLKGCFDELWM